MSDNLTAQEISALADVFWSETSARQLLERMGVRRGRQPVWNVGSALEFWHQVDRELSSGLVRDGRQRLLAAAREAFPANPEFGRAPDGGDSPAVWRMPWPRNPNFTGRDQEMVGLRERFGASGSVVVLPQALHGLGGVGKTQLAVEYTYRHRAEYDLVWWIDSEQPGAVVASLAELATRLGVAAVGEDSESARRVVEVLATRRVAARWLVVVDNAGAPSDLHLRGLLSAASERGHVLVTSRNADWARVARSLDVDVLPREEAVSLLRRRVPRLTYGEADAVAGLLGDLPLALEQAAAWLAQTAMSAADYGKLVVESSKRILAESKPIDYPMPVAATWAAAVESLEPAAVVLIRMWALLGPETIPKDLVSPDRCKLLPAPLDAVSCDPVAFGRLVRSVVSHSLVRVVTDGIAMHRLVQAVLRDLTPRADRLALREACQRLLVACDPGDPTNPDYWPRYEALRAHALAAGIVESGREDCRQFLLRLTLVVLARGDFVAGLSLAREVHERWRDSLGVDHPGTLAAGANVAAALLKSGDYRSARTMLEQLKADRDRVLGQDHPDSLLTSANLAAALLRAGEYRDSLDVGAEALRRSRLVLGEDHRSTLEAALAYARALWAVGSYQRAHEVLEDLLARSRKSRGDSHPETLAVVEDLATTRWSMDDLAGARELSEQLADRRRDVLGPDHPDTLAAVGAVGSLLRSTGDYAAARVVFEGVLDRSRRLLGENHPDTVSATAHLASTLCYLGNYAEATILLDDVLARSRAIHGEFHPETVQAAIMLAIVLSSGGNLPGARVLVGEMLERFSWIPREKCINAFMAVERLSLTLKVVGEHETAQEMLDDIRWRRRTMSHDGSF